MAKNNKNQAGDYVMALAKKRGNQARESYSYALVLGALFVPSLL